MTNMENRKPPTLFGRLKTCRGCGKTTFLKTDVCRECQWKFGEVWVLDMVRWRWSLEKRNG